MAEVTFYHNERADGGQRTGLLADGARALEYFRPGGDDPDPTLLWHVSLTVVTDHALASSVEALQWLQQHGNRLRRLLSEAADDLTAGIDLDLAGWSWEDTDSEGPFRMAIAATKTFVATGVGRRLKQLVASWDALTSQLAPATESDRAWVHG